MQSPFSKLKLIETALMSLAIYLGAQSVLSFQDRTAAKDVLAAICRSIQADLQTGAVRNALDNIASSLTLARPERSFHIIYRGRGNDIEIGKRTNAPAFTCKISGRTDVEIDMFSEQRNFVDHWEYVLPASLLFSIILVHLFSYLNRRVIDSAITTFEAEIQKIFDASQTTAPAKTLLARYLNIANRPITKRAKSAVSTMKTKLEAQNELIRNQSVSAALGEVVAQVAHDIRSPLSLLSVISKRHQNLDRELIEKAVTRLNQIASDVLTTRRNLATGTRDGENVDSMIRATIDMMSVAKSCNIQFQNSGVAFRLSSENCDGFMRSLAIILENAVESATSEGRIVVTTSVDRKSGLSISVEDSGPGFPASILSYGPVAGISTKENGNGLGLKSTHAWVRALGGDLHIANRELRGGLVTLTLPNILNQIQLQSPWPS